MSVSFAAVDLPDNIQPKQFVIFDVFEPVVEFGSVLCADDLVENLLGH